MINQASRYSLIQPPTFRAAIYHCYLNCGYLNFSNWCKQPGLYWRSLVTIFLLSLILLVLMLININGHISPDPHSPCDIVIFLPLSWKNGALVLYCTEIRQNSSKVRPGCRSHFNYRTCCKYLMNSVLTKTDTTPSMD